MFRREFHGRVSSEKVNTTLQNRLPVQLLINREHHTGLDPSGVRAVQSATWRMFTSPSPMG